MRLLTVSGHHESSAWPLSHRTPCSLGSLPPATRLPDGGAGGPDGAQHLIAGGRSPDTFHVRAIALLLLIEEPEPWVGPPGLFDGDSQFCENFLISCSLLFSRQTWTLASEAAGVGVTITYLSRRAWLKGLEEWERQTLACASFSAFAVALHTIFGRGSLRDTAARELLRLHYGEHSGRDFPMWGPEKSGAHHTAYATHHTSPRWPEWKQLSLAHSSL